jgi:hypothetical protein
MTMSQEPTAPTPGEGQTPEPVANGQEPPASPTEGTTPKVYDEAYVKALRKEAAEHRTKASKMETELGQLRDRDKSDSERLAERVTESEQRASEAETRALRFEIAAERGLQLADAMHFAGTTREEVEASADHWAKRMAETQPSKAPGFDGGPRQTPEHTKPPEQEHNDLLLRAMGRTA